jgi:hypothetical protein
MTWGKSLTKIILWSCISINWPKKNIICVTVRNFGQMIEKIVNLMQNRNITNTKECYQKTIMTGRFIGYTPISNGISKCKILCWLLRLISREKIQEKTTNSAVAKLRYKHVLICSHHSTKAAKAVQTIIPQTKQGKQWLLYPNVLPAVLSYNDWYTSRWELWQQKQVINSMDQMAESSTEIL